MSSCNISFLMNELQGDSTVSVFITVLLTIFTFTGIIFTVQIFVFWIIIFFNDSCAGFFVSCFLFYLFFFFLAGRQDYYSWCFPAFHLSQLSFSPVFWTFRVLHSSILGKVLQIVIGQYSQWRGESVQLFIFLWSCQLEGKKEKRKQGSSV